MQTNGTQKLGLEGVIAAETRLSRVDGLKGELLIGGYPLESIAPTASFTELAYLLWYGNRPTTAELAQFESELASVRELPAASLQLLAAVAAAKQPVMTALRIVAGTLDLDLAAHTTDDTRAKVLLARSATAVAAYWRLLNGERPLAPDPELGHAANYLWMLSGTKPSDARARALETYLNTIVDHGLNASTFTARVIIATRSDLTSAIVGAIGALKGPLHGGAPGPALDMVFEIGSAENAEPWLRAKLGQGDRLMGFGHRVYKVYDPRAVVLANAAQSMYATDGDMALYTLAKQVETTALHLLEEHKPGRKLQTNVEYYTALLLHGLGLDSDLFSPTFAIGRTAGWIAHCFEHQATGRLIRPKAAYVGAQHDTWPA